MELAPRAALTVITGQGLSQAPVAERPIALPPVRLPMDRPMVQLASRSPRLPRSPSTFTPTLLIRPIACPRCGEKAGIIRRAPDARQTDGSEFWAFQCDQGHITEIAGQR